MAISYLPSIKFTIWYFELGVGVTLTLIPSSSKKPLFCATKIGQLKPPGKTITSNGLGELFVSALTAETVSKNVNTDSNNFNGFIVTTLKILKVFILATG